jgi:hypothetical protein
VEGESLLGKDVVSGGWFFEVIDFAKFYNSILSDLTTIEVEWDAEKVAAFMSWHYSQCQLGKNDCEECQQALSEAAARDAMMTKIINHGISLLGGTK